MMLKASLYSSYIIPLMSPLTIQVVRIDTNDWTPLARLKCPYFLRIEQN